MIAKSDFIILTISSLALVAGVARWQQNIAAPSIAAAPPASAPAVERAALEPGRDAADSVAGSLAAGSDALSRSAADAALTVRRTGSDLSTRDTDTTASLATGSTAPATPDAEPAGTEFVASIADESDRALYGTYRVRSGDYLGRIANRFGTSVATLKEINEIEGTLIEIGQEIRYPQPAN